MNRLLRENWLTLLIATILIIGYAVLRTRGDQLASTDMFDAQVTAGKATIVEFYSNT